MLSLAALSACSSATAGATAPVGNRGLVTRNHHTSNSVNINANDTHSPVHKPGWCAFGTGGSCGSKSLVPLPCAEPSPAQPVSDSLRASLESICGITDYTHSCCNEESLSRLSDSLQQASAFIALCPACSDSFRRYYCEFTCSPDQSTFINITSTQNLTSGDSNDGPAVKSLDLYVNPTFGQAFYNACKDVKFAATNGYAMEFIGGNAKDWISFLRYMGQERPGLGSPFQINFPKLADPSLEDGDGTPSDNTTVPIPEGIVPLNPPKLDCADSCACADCPARCLSLPPLPDTSSHCHIGALTCGSFFLILAYSILLLSFILGIGIRDLWARRHAIFAGGHNALGGGGTGSKQGRIHLSSSPGEYDRLNLGDHEDDDEDPDGGVVEGEEGLNMTSTSNNENASNARVDPSSSRWRRKLSNFMRRSDSDPHRSETSSSTAKRRNRGDSESNSQRLGRGASILSPDVLAAYSQPRTYKLNNILSSAFYKLGLLCASSPYITIIIGLIICGILNSGWAKFGIEKDPVRLWVEKGSELAVQKRVFEEEFGPFYRTEQVFLSRQSHRSGNNNKHTQHDGQDGENVPILDWDTLNWWAGIEAEVRELKSPAGTRLSDICFAPTASSDDPAQRTSEDCTVQSFMGYFKNTLDGLNEDTWRKELDYCARTPTACLSSAGQPLNPKLLFGGPSVSSAVNSEEDDRDRGLMDLTISSQEGEFKASQAEAIVITYVIDNSLDTNKIKKAAEWERTLKAYLDDLSKKAEAERGIRLSFSTEVSLEEELNKSTNTDVPIVVLSYLVMFFYVSLSLGGTGEGILFLIWALLVRAFSSASKLVKKRRKSAGPIALGDDPYDNPQYSTTPSRRSISSAMRTIFVDSKFTLGLVGIAIVLLSVSTSVGIFSFCGVKVTLIIAEVIPFLVLAIGVDNVFILLHELQRQNARAYGNIRTVSGLPPPALLAIGTSSALGGLPHDEEEEEEEEIDESDLPSAEERIARALGRMGPSILLSASCQTVAFGLGAVVGMPAVRNFAIYAAGAVAINAMLQITVFVAFMTLDLKRIEVSLGATQLVEGSAQADGEIDS